MTNKFLAALTAGLLLGSTAVFAADKPAAAAAPKLNKDVRKALMTAQDLVKKSDLPGAMAAINTGKAVSDKTPYDDLELNRYAMSVAVQMKDFAAADAAAEAAADTDPALIPDTEKLPVYNAAMQIALNVKHMDKAAKYAKLLLALNPPADAESQDLAVRALYAGGDYAGATAIAQKNIDAATAAGKVPARTDLDIVMAGQVKQKDEAGAEKTLETLVATYNMPEDWTQILAVSLGTKGMREIDYIYVGRLMIAVGAKIASSDAQLIGGTANSRLALYGDAETMQKLGGPAPDPREAADKKSLPAQIAAGAKQGGEYNVKTAEALYGYGMFPEAEKLARDAKAKGGVKDPSEADMVIGMSLAAQGKYADAQAVFAAVNAPNPASQRIARLWGYYVKNKANPPVAAATPAPAPAPAK